MSRAILLCVLLLLAPTLVHGQDKPEVVAPVVKMVADQETLSGRLEPAALIEIRPRVTGYLEKTLVKEGSLVRAGEILFEIDSRPLVVKVETARAQIAMNEAMLRQARTSAERMAALLRTGQGSREEAEKSLAEVAVAEANLVAARTNLDAAQIQLGFARVLAPIEGVVGRHRLSVGNLVKADETLLTTVVRREPMIFRVELPEAVAVRLSKKGMKINELPVEIQVTGDDAPRKATIDFVDNRIDPKKGTLVIGGSLAKTEGLLPGTSFTLRLETSPPRQVLLVPGKALVVQKIDGKRAASVFVLRDNQLAERRVEVGSWHGDMVAVTGIQANDQVAVNPPRPAAPPSPPVPPSPK